ncbi:hypothetical protein VC83_04479 [Pseudogymnoascus destructans]|uniref:Uncharacterized protein n=2 Tax=Pseudogymnoascus destructans TaxID=655981 RepID=L8FSR8_PSED2|nr:uncharacterized protein VC83_04479 [Pseudogymnoascus destructans]ELR02756.1 hypothetical protein GMDG_05700 [Pseudogymnoascus destructans 20631-21]OAF59244.1 hypothetical protein VC83_04479 [Pseudogymnoascus destructans]
MSHYDSFSSQYQGTAPAVFYYTSPWTVTPAAKDQLEVNFTIAIEGLGLTARLSYDHDKHFFKIDCLPAEKAIVYTMFSRVIDAFLKEQVGPTVKKESTLATKIGPIPFGVRSAIKEAQDEVLLQGFMKTEWSCPRIEQLGGVFGTKLLGKIGQLTECTLTYNSELRIIKIVGPDQETCHRAILKLDKVRDYEVPLFNNPFANQAHLFYAEEHTEYAPIPTPLKVIHALDLYENTLLDISAYPPTLNSPYLALSKSAILRCAIYNENRRGLRPLPLPKKPDPLTIEAQKGAEYKVFAKHKFAGKGDVDPLVGVIEDVEQVEGEEAEGDIELEKKAKIVVWVRDVEENGTVPEDVASEEKGLISPVKEKVGGSIQADKITGTTFNGDSKKQNAGVSPVQAATAMNTIPPHLRRLFEPLARGPAPQRRSLLDMDIEDNLSFTMQPFSLQSTTLAAPTVPRAPTNPVKPPSDLPKPTTGSPQPLIEPLIETLQTTSEPSTRTYHHTINLHAASTSKGHWVGNTFVPAAPPSLLSTHFVTSLHTATVPVLQALRGWRGSAKLEVKIGRIWIAHDALQLSESDARGAAGIVEKRRMARWLEGGRRADMTTLVTEEAGDVEAIVGMKLFEQDGRFWGKTPKWGIEYQFSCVDPREGGGEGEEGKFMVTVDAETFRWKCETREGCLGETWVHCLKRVWDFKVCATGRQEVGGEYKEWAEELVEGLYVPPNTDITNLTLSFTLPAPHALSFPTIRIARKCTYTSTTTLVLLHITEMHDLLVERVGHTPSGQIVYRASTRPGRGETDQEARWFEVSLSGKGWEGMLAEEIEVGGERMGWGDDLKNRVEEVVGTAAAVVKGMEGVGGWNTNPFGEVLRGEERRKREEKKTWGKEGRGVGW